MGAHITKRLRTDLRYEFDRGGCRNNKGMLALPRGMLTPIKHILPWNEGYACTPEAPVRERVGIYRATAEIAANELVERGLLKKDSRVLVVADCLGTATGAIARIVTDGTIHILSPNETALSTICRNPNLRIRNAEHALKLLEEYGTPPATEWIVASNMAEAEYMLVKRTMESIEGLDVIFIPFLTSGRMNVEMGIHALMQLDKIGLIREKLAAEGIVLLGLDELGMRFTNETIETWNRYFFNHPLLRYGCTEAVREVITQTNIARILNGEPEIDGSIGRHTGRLKQEEIMALLLNNFGLQMVGTPEQAIYEIPPEKIERSAEHRILVLLGYENENLAENALRIALAKPEIRDMTDQTAYFARTMYVIAKKAEYEEPKSSDPVKSSRSFSF